MENKIETKIDINFYYEDGEYLIGSSHDEKKFYIAKIINKPTEDYIEEFNNIKYFNLLEIKSRKYEVIEIGGNLNKTFIHSLLISITKLNLDLISSMRKIDSLLKEIFNNITLDQVRGTFGELKAMDDFKLIPKINEFSVFDFNNPENIDVEIKTYSKVKRDVQISYQQLTNSKETIFYFIEIEESMEGESLLELATKVNADSIERYQWIFKTKSKLINDKYKSNNYIKTNASNLSAGLEMPLKAKDAKFIFNVDLIE